LSLVLVAALEAAAALCVCPGVAQTVPASDPEPPAAAGSTPPATPQTTPPIPPQNKSLPQFARFTLPPGADGALSPLLDQVADAQQHAEQLVRADTDAEDDESALRHIEQTATGVLATEGYFAPRLTATADAAHKARFAVAVDPGTRATITRVEIELTGAVNSEPARAEELKKSWTLPLGRPFRDADWAAAKRKLLAAVQQHDFAAARLLESNAAVDAAAATVVLHLAIDSGPAFTLGALDVRGLKRFDTALVARYNTFKPGDRYDATQLLEFQRRLQGSGYFASAVVDVPTDTEHPTDAPLRVDIVEAKRRRVQLGAGYSTDVGPEVQATYRQTDVFGFPTPLQAGIGFDRTRSVGYTDLYFPPNLDGAVDSVGILGERTDINAVETRRTAFGVARRYTHAEGNTATGEGIIAPRAAIATETKLGINLQRETVLQPVDGFPVTTASDVVYGSLGWTRRAVDDPTFPTRGSTLALEGDLGLTHAGDINLSHASIKTLVDDAFGRVYGRYVRYVPLSSRDQLTLRAELGAVIADSATLSATTPQVPTTLLFRAGGSGSVRGYSYQSLGDEVAGTTVYSPELAVGSLEYAHWFTHDWGAAVFHDRGGAGDDLRHLEWGRGTGVGARWRTLAGPLALDVAYGDRLPGGLGGRWRIDFSVLVAF
jgi:translocation and assembly module TamA